jgi:hypothetical protein
MNPKDVLDAAQLIATAGAAVVILVQMVKLFIGVDSPRARVAVAVISGAILTALFALSNGIFTIANAFALVIAAITIAATGAGVHSAATAVAKTDTPQ